MTQPVVEVQAIQDPKAVGEGEDLLGQQIPVPFENAPFGDPVVEQWDSAVQVPHREVVDLLRQVWGGRARWFFSKRLRQRPPPLAQCSRGARPFHIGATARQAMESDEQLDQRLGRPLACQIGPAAAIGDLPIEVAESAAHRAAIRRRGSIVVGGPGDR